VSGFFDLALLFDLALSILLIITIIYGVILNRKLKVLRDAQTAMPGLATEFGAALGRAEEGLAKVRAEVQENGQALARRIEAAERLSSDLARLEKRAAGTSDRLEMLNAAAHDDAHPARRPVNLGRQMRSAASATDVPADEAPPLVKALRGLR
jgi:methyl-accepting chemotaxis protein